MDFSFARRAVVATVGHVSWQPPGWLRSLLRALSAHRRAAALVFLLAAAAVGGRYAYTHRKLPPPPRSPDIVHARIIAPGVPPVTDKLVIPTLDIRFSASAAPLNRVDDKVPANVVRLEPALPGEWHWDGDRVLVFQPTQPWPPAQTYHVTVTPAALGPRVKADQYELETKTPDFEGKIDHAEFYQDPKDPNARKVTATLVFSHAVDAAELERRLSVTMLGGSPVFAPYSPPKVFALTPGRHGREWFLRTVPLTLPKETDTMKLRVADGLSSAQGSARLPKELTETVKVPDLYSVFRIDSADTRIVKDKDGNPEQFLFIETTCALKTEDLAKALEVYALPRVNPTHVKDKDDESTDDDADKKSDDSDSEEDDDSDGSSSSGSPAGNHDGRFHDDSNEDRTKEGTETADRLDSATPPDAWAADEVDADILKKSKRVTLTLVPSHDEQTTTHTFRFRDDKPGSLFVRVAKNTPAPGGYLLRDEYTSRQDVPVPEREITIRGEGGVLALSGERKLSIQSRGIPAIRFEVARVPVAEINHLITQTYGDFQKPEFHGDRFNEQDLARITVETQTIHLRSPVEANYSTFDFTGHLKPVAADGLGTEGPVLPVRLRVGPEDEQVRDVPEGFGGQGQGHPGRALHPRDGPGPARQAQRRREPRRVRGFARHRRAARRGGGQHPRPQRGHAGHRADRRGGPRQPAKPGQEPARFARTGGHRGAPQRRRVVPALLAQGPHAGFFALPHRRDRDARRQRVGGVRVHRARRVPPGDTLHIGTMVKQRDWTGKLDGLPLETEVIDAEDHAVETKEVTLPTAGSSSGPTRRRTNRPPVATRSTCMYGATASAARCSAPPRRR